MEQYPIVMKNLTILKSAILALLVCVGFVACENNSSEVIEEPETYTVKLGWGGEILDVHQEPLSSRASGNDLYGIQVYSKSGESSSWTPYAYGLFDDPNNISIKLLNDAKYKFVATMIKDGKNKVYKSFTEYSTPFVLSGTSDAKVELNNFIFNVQDGLEYLRFGTTSMKTPNDSGYLGHYDCPNTDRYYGELSDYVPNADNAKATIQMKRTAFGAKFIAEGELANSGILEVQITDAPKMTLELTESDDVLFDIFTFKEVAAAWAAKGDYTETVNVAINWISPENVVMPLGTHEVTFKRNTTTVVTVNIEQQSETAGIGFGFDSSEQGNPAEDGENDVTVGGGSSTDTDVEVNQ
jgi:hypothetical protein